MTPPIEALRFQDGHLQLLDQRRLPAETRWLMLRSSSEVAQAIRDLVVRGAPAIGIAAGYACVMAAEQATQQGSLDDWSAALDELAAARPTAVNLMWAIDRMRELAAAGQVPEPTAVLALAQSIHEDDQRCNQRIAEHGLQHLPHGCRVLTHCNTGSLATGGLGTALGIITTGWARQQITAVTATETRPWLQGSRLTAWELSQAGVPARLVVDSAAAALMKAGEIDWVITGADRIAANGDVANKIGTYALAVLAKAHGVKMMVAAPSSTLDLDLPSGAGMVIEERADTEIWSAAGLREAPAGITTWNPVFDVTPAELIDVIITEAGRYEVKPDA